jgi:hypothetical protein
MTDSGNSLLTPSSLPKIKHMHDVGDAVNGKHPVNLWRKILTLCHTDDGATHFSNFESKQELLGATHE